MGSLPVVAIGRRYNAQDHSIDRRHSQESLHRHRKAGAPEKTAFRLLATKDQQRTPDCIPCVRQGRRSECDNCILPVSLWPILIRRSACLKIRHAAIKALGRYGEPPLRCRRPSCLGLEPVPPGTTALLKGRRRFSSAPPNLPDASPGPPGPFPAHAIRRRSPPRGLSWSAQKHPENATRASRDTGSRRMPGSLEQAANNSDS